MRYYIDLCESLSDVAIDRLLLNFGDEIQKRLDRDKSLEPNQRYKIDPLGLIKLLEEADPTPNSMYTRRLLQWWLKGEFRYFEDIGKAYDVLDIYHKAKSKMGDLSDIGKISSFSALYALTRDFKDQDLRSNAQKDREEGEEYIKSGDAVIYYDSPEIKIIIPKTIEAAQYFGRNTQWCTSAKSNNHFNYYNNLGPLYIILFKKENKRWQFHFETSQFMDENDEEIYENPKRVIELFDEDKWMTAIKENGYLIQYFDNPSEEMQRLAVQESGHAITFIKNPSEEVKKLAVQEDGNSIKFIENPSEELQRLAIKNCIHAVRYIKNPSEEIKREIKKKLDSIQNEKIMEAKKKRKKKKKSFPVSGVYGWIGYPFDIGLGDGGGDGGF